MQRNEQLQRLASKVAASWTARASTLDARDVFAEFVELRPALAENVDEGLRREVRNGEAAIRDYLITLCEDRRSSTSSTASTRPTVPPS